MNNAAPVTSVIAWNADRQYLAWDAAGSEWLLLREGDLRQIVTTALDDGDEPPSGLCALPLQDEPGDGTPVALIRVGRYLETDLIHETWQIRDEHGRSYGQFDTAKES